MKSMTLTIICAFILFACTPQPTPTPIIDRESVIPSNQVKISPADDIYPPKSLTAEYSDPIPLPYPINTAGAEDSAFVTPDGKTLYIWFTPDPRLPAEMQLSDGVTGIYVSHKQPDGWSKPERVWLQENGKVALDGCEFILDKIIWFCTVREGYEGINWFTANLKDGAWQNWLPADFNPEYQVGELHITTDGKELYFHSPRPGGKGGLDVWVSNFDADEWQTPTNVETINTAENEGWPFISPDGSQLWFTRSSGAPSLWRSKRVNGQWAKPEEMFAPFAGEVSMDFEGNLYFTHHFYQDGVMLEADIYTASPTNNPN